MRRLRLAQSTAAAAVSSTLTLPVLARRVVVRSVDVYAASWDAFAGLHHDIALVFGAWAPGAVVNADLPFSTRQEAEQAPDALRVSLRIQIGVGIVAEAHGLDLRAARDELRQAARRAGLTGTPLAPSDRGVALTDRNHGPLGPHRSRAVAGLGVMARCEGPFA